VNDSWSNEVALQSEMALEKGFGTNKKLTQRLKPSTEFRIK